MERRETRWEKLGCNIWKKKTILTVPVPSTIVLQYMTVLLKKSWIYLNENRNDAQVKREPLPSWFYYILHLRIIFARRQEKERKKKVKIISTRGRYNIKAVT